MECGRRFRPVESFAVADEQMLWVEAREHVRWRQSQEEMHSGGAAAAREVVQQRSQEVVPDQDNVSAVATHEMVDISLSALRMGAHEVHVVCLEDRAHMPADMEEIVEAETEGISTFRGNVLLGNAVSPVFMETVFLKIESAEHRSEKVICLVLECVPPEVSKPAYPKYSSEYDLIPSQLKITMTNAIRSIRNIKSKLMQGKNTFPN